jgi:methylmalonyl-CoA mutase
LRMLEAEGLALEEARAEIAFLLTADADEYLSLAKFRALRRLWARVETACGLAPKPMRLHAETAFRMMTRYDPWVNILRATMGTFCAGVGGADAITILPFTLALGLPDDFARRLARNSQLILIHESHLAKVADPAAGAGSFEALTNALCAHAWRLFQNFEAQGGMLKSLKAGVPQREIGAAAAARLDAIAHRTLAITGTSAFALLAEAPVHVLAPSPVTADKSQAAQGGVALPSRRDAEPYEKLRKALDNQLNKTGARPQIFFANLEEPQGFAEAFAFAKNFFAAAGIEAFSRDGSETASEAECFRASGCKIACICASRAAPTEAVSEAARSLRDAGATRVYLAGHQPGEAAAALLKAGVVDDLICTKSNALVILRQAAAMALRE